MKHLHKKKTKDITYLIKRVNNMNPYPKKIQDDYYWPDTEIFMLNRLLI